MSKYTEPSGYFAFQELHSFAAIPYPKLFKTVLRAELGSFAIMNFGESFVRVVRPADDPDA